MRILDFSDGFTSATEPTATSLAYSIVATQSISGGGTISLSSSSAQILKVAGDGGAQVASTTPFGASPPADGTIIKVMGTHATNTLEIQHNDALNGCILNGSAVLGEYDQITLIYHSALSRYVEDGRNF